MGLLVGGVAPVVNGAGAAGAGVRALVIDELHNVLAGRGEARREFLNLLRFPGSELTRSDQVAR
jgi:hypothetical protein